jgi:replicative DNA helicase
MNRDQLTELPHSAEAEDAVLGTLMTTPRAIHWAAALDAAAFYQPFEAAAFAAMLALGAEGRPVDPIAVFERMREANPSLSNKGLEALQECAAWHVTEKQFRGYVRIINEHHRMRELHRVGGEIAELGLERGPDGHAKCSTCGHSNCSTWPPVFEALIPASSQTGG